MALAKKDGDLLMAIDQGTTSSRVIVFDRAGAAKAQASLEHKQFYPEDGWVEHDATEIWKAVQSVCKKALDGRNGNRIAAIGITNQRETTVFWDKKTGEPVHKAIVWQDRRTADMCADLKAAGHEEMVTRKTGLLLDPYFSGTKVAWLLRNVKKARDLANADRLAFGTIDTWLVWNLTGGEVFATDVTNASRTLLFNIEDGVWDAEILKLLDIPEGILPEVKPCVADFGVTTKKAIGKEIPILGMAGDQQAATVGQTCFQPGMIKSTYGTGCFALLNTGETRVNSSNRLLSTIGYALDEKPIYALEGSIFIAGSVIKWLRDSLGLLATAEQSADLAAQASDASGAYFVPAFTGLGAPHWDPDARGMITGLTLDAGPAEIVRAAIDAVCFQTRDLINAMTADVDLGEIALRIDGGMAANDWFMQRLSDLVGVQVERPESVETTALGAAYLAGLGCGLYDSLDDLSAQWRVHRTCEPLMGGEERDTRYAGWQTAVAKALSN